MEGEELFLLKGRSYCYSNPIAPHFTIDNDRFLALHQNIKSILPCLLSEKLLSTTTPPPFPLTRPTDYRYKKHGIYFKVISRKSQHRASVAKKPMFIGKDESQCPRFPFLVVSSHHKCQIFCKCM